MLTTLGRVKIILKLEFFAEEVDVLASEEGEVDDGFGAILETLLADHEDFADVVLACE